MDKMTEVRNLWKQACEWEGISVDSKFVNFSKDNPYVARYNELLCSIMKERQGKV